VIVLSIIVGIGVIKEGVTDYSRHQSDKKMNRINAKLKNYIFRKENIQATSR
jgi:hypothetical protein